jgi:glutamate/tyrosine decarboxylase-like PLP-dependent enzyme
MIDNKRATPIDISRDDFRAIGHKLVDEIADLFDELPNRRVTSGKKPDEIRALLGAASLPEHGTDAKQLIEHASRLVMDNSLYNAHPRFWGYITAGAAPIGVLGDLLASAVNPNVGGWVLSPLATELELQTVRWIAELLGYPRDSGGILVSGGNTANFVGFLAARAAKGDEDLRTKGVVSGTNARLRVYCSAETHTWVQKACDMYGLGTDATRWIPVDQDFRMNVSVLRAKIEDDRKNGDRPFMVVGTAGSVSTGAIDPLPEIHSICQEFDLWFHVDGAYGGFAACVPDVHNDIRALALADSVAVDPHKWLYAPLEAGCALVRDPEKLHRAFSYRPKYYHLGDETTNLVEYGPQNSRGFRALKVWLQLQQAGRAGYVQMIGDDIALARHAYDLVAKHPELEAATQSLSITTFRFIPKDLRASVGEAKTEEYLGKLNEELLSEIEKRGEIFLSPAVLHDRYYLRMCIVNFRTTRADVEALPEIVARTGREVDARLRA